MEPGFPTKIRPQVRLRDTPASLAPCRRALEGAWRGRGFLPACGAALLLALVPGAWSRSEGAAHRPAGETRAQEGGGEAGESQGSVDGQPAARTERVVEIPGLEGRFADHSARAGEGSSTAGAHALRAQDQARRAGKALLEEKPVVAIGALTIARDDLASAIAIAPHLQGLHGDRGLVGLALARACRQRERLPEAEDALVEAVRDLAAEMSVYPTAAAVLNHALGARAAAEAALERGAPAEAEAILRAALPSLASALERAPTDAGLLLARARILALLSRWSADPQSSAEALDRALTDFDHAIALAPWDARPRGWRGVARVEAGDADGGRADLEQALSLGPEADLRATFEAALRELGADLDESR